MHVQPLFSMNNAASSVNSEVWFMNRVSASGVSKIPTSISLGTKQRSMENILGFSLINCQSQKHVRRCGFADDVQNGSYGFGYTSSDRNETGFSMKSLPQLLADDDNEEMEKMTLDDMRRMLRKTIEKSTRKAGSGEPAAGNHSCSSSDSGTLPSVDSEAPSVGLELLLEDSTSNSSESMSLKRDLAGISSSSGTSRGFLQGNSEDLRCGHKRLSMGSEPSEKTEVAEDDEWTLQKWQKLCHKQCTGRKRLRTACKVQQEISESIGEVCSNSPSLAFLDVSAGISEVESSQGASFLSEKVVKDNCEIDSYECKLHERVAAVKDPLPTAGILAHEHSCEILPSSQSHSLVSLELVDESEIAPSKASIPGRLQNTSKNGWTLKVCSKIEATPLPKLALQQQAMLGGKTSFDLPFGKAGELSNFNPDRASIKVAGQRKQFEDITLSLSPVNASASKDQRTATPVHNTDGTCKPRAVLSEMLRHLYVNQIHTTLSNKPSNSLTEQLEGTLSLEHFKGTDCLVPSDSIASQLNSKGLPNFSASLNCMETLEIEEEHEPHQKPAKIPCKRKAISPMSQEFLLKASKLGMKKHPLVFDEGWVDVPKWTFGANERNGKKPEALQGSPCHAKEQCQVSKVLESDALSIASSEKCVVGLTTTTSRHVLDHLKKISLVSPNSPSKPQNGSRGTTTISPAGSSPLMPAKGILRSSCQGPCGCEECASVRFRAERASEFSQRQMQDIEGLAVKLMKDLSILRNVVEDRLIQSSVKHQSPRPVLSVDQLKKVTANSLETEETAKKWLVRMARDCNRYCKIMRMQGRKLTFADESGGKLCHVKVFRSEPISDSSTGLNGRPLDANCSTSSILNEPAVEVVCPVKDTI